MKTKAHTKDAHEPECVGNSTIRTSLSNTRAACDPIKPLPRARILLPERLDWSSLAACRKAVSRLLVS
jgi:hypothetical protein